MRQQRQAMQCTTCYRLEGTSLASAVANISDNSVKSSRVYANASFVQLTPSRHVSCKKRAIWPESAP